MILHVSPASPWWVHAAANVVLVTHIGAGCVGLATGAVAAVARKGQRLHRYAGNAFVMAMLVMAGIGILVAPLLPQLGSVIGGSFTFYLVLTGWLTVRRAPQSAGTAERVAGVGALLIAAAAFAFGVRALQLPSGELDGTPAGPYFVFAGLAALAGALDWRVAIRGGLSGPARLARHLWRMLVALLIAAVSFFLGQSQVFPDGLRHSALLYVPEIAILCLLAFWLVRIRWPGAAGRRPNGLTAR